MQEQRLDVVRQIVVHNADEIASQFVFHRLKGIAPPLFSQLSVELDRHLVPKCGISKSVHDGFSTGALHEMAGKQVKKSA